MVEADTSGTAPIQYTEYFESNIVNGAADFVKLNQQNDLLDQRMPGLYLGEDDGKTIVLQIYPSGAIVYLAKSSDGTLWSYDGEYNVIDGKGTFNISPAAPGIHYEVVSLGNDALKIRTCKGICERENMYEITFRKIR